MAKLIDKPFPAGRAKLALLLLICALAVTAFIFSFLVADKASSNGVFKLREVSVFEQGNEAFLRGQRVRCQDEPFREVKAYPAFASRAPIYGLVRFGEKYGETNSGIAFHFAVDESGGTGKGYDRLYFDHNRDLDLRNDAVARRQKRPPAGATQGMNMAGIKETVIFDFLHVNLGADAAGSNRVEVMPRLTLAGGGKNTYKWMSFVGTRVLEGNIAVGGEKFRACLGDDFAIHSGLDSPYAALVLERRGRPGDQAFDWWGGDRLMAVHKIKGRFFTFSATAAGDQLFVRPYQGDVGTFAIGPGNRALTNLSVSGSFRGQERTVPVGGDMQGSRPWAARSCQVPAGDYLPEFLRIEFGRLTIEVSQNYHSEGKRQDRCGRPQVYGITVRKDKPFILDFSSPPEVMFTSPTNGSHIRLGDTVQVSAVLVDPKLDLMLRRLEDTTGKQPRTADGRPPNYGRNRSLDPQVIITRANGEKVAGGVMPFG
jgi:hypothetical protein